MQTDLLDAGYTVIIALISNEEILEAVLVAKHPLFN
jgi:hypothetical protein